MTLYSRSCSGYSQDGDTMSYKACQGLVKNGTLDGIRTRINDGVHKSAPLVYHGIGGLLNLMQLQDIDKEFYWLRGLNQTRKLLGKVTALSDHKRLLIAMASGRLHVWTLSFRSGYSRRRGSKGFWHHLRQLHKAYIDPKALRRKRTCACCYFGGWEETGLPTFINAHSMDQVSHTCEEDLSYPPLSPPMHSPLLNRYE